MYDAATVCSVRETVNATDPRTAAHATISCVTPQDAWNKFDLVLVVFAVFDIIIHAVQANFLRALRILRMQKLLRVLRAVRLAKVVSMAKVGDYLCVRQVDPVGFVGLFCVPYVVGTVVVHNGSAYGLPIPPARAPSCWLHLRLIHGHPLRLEVEV